jgi:putative GTP pyrophosphokinase
VAAEDIGEADRARIAELVEHYKKNILIFELFLNNLQSITQTPPLKSLYHSLRLRVKDPEHLREKLERKVRKANSTGVAFDITISNLFERINDLAGLRLLHLHTTEFPRINKTLLEVLEEHQYRLVSGPVARAWDIELRDYFKSIGVETVESERMYTSVHYVVEANRKTKATAEIQVRTLAEELWGEVDHKINYPEQSPKLACREQIKVLARVTASCTRLVDAIFRTHDETPGHQAGPKRDQPGAATLNRGQPSAGRKRGKTRV